MPTDRPVIGLVVPDSVPRDPAAPIAHRDGPNVIDLLARRKVDEAGEGQRIATLPDEQPPAPRDLVGEATRALSAILGPSPAGLYVRVSRNEPGAIVVRLPAVSLDSLAHAAAILAAHGGGEARVAVERTVRVADATAKVIEAAERWREWVGDGTDSPLAAAVDALRLAKAGGHG